MFDDADAIRRRLLEERSRTTDNLIGKMARPDLLTDAMKFTPLMARTGEVNAEEDANAADRTYARTKLLGGGSATLVSAATFNLLDENNPNAVAAYVPGTAIVTAPGKRKTVLAKFDTPIEYVHTTPASLILMISAEVTAMQCHADTSGATDGSISIGVIEADYDPTTITWNLVQAGTPPIVSVAANITIAADGNGSASDAAMVTTVTGGAGLPTVFGINNPVQLGATKKVYALAFYNIIGDNGGAATGTITLANGIANMRGGLWREP